MNFSAPMNGVRLATLDDLPRISVVAAAALFSSPTFKFQRSHYKDFPSDTVAGYFVEYEKAIKDAACVVLVAEDVLDKNEAQHVYDELRYAYDSETSNHEGVVGVCSIRLKPGSCYIDQFQSASMSVSIVKPDTHLTSNSVYSHDVRVVRENACHLKRDRCPKALEIYEAVTTPAKLKHLEGKMRVLTLAVTPFYWRRGYARRLVSFCTQLADLDNAVVVSATVAHLQYSARRLTI
jgi:ribosomal protein S18 acetylase RimI-like enzyme